MPTGLSTVEETFRREFGRAVATLVRLFGDIDLAEEAVQEAFTVAVQKWPAAGVPPNPGGWIVTTARNRAIDSLRRRQSEPHTVSTSMGSDSEDDEHDMLQELASPDAGPLELLGQAADARALRGCIGALSGEQQQSLALAFYQGLSHAEVADQLRQPLGTVKSWVRRALQSLKTCLERATTG